MMIFIGLPAFTKMENILSMPIPNIIAAIGTSKKINRPSGNNGFKADINIAPINGIKK